MACQLPSGLPHVSILSPAAAPATDIPINLFQSWHCATVKETPRDFKRCFQPLPARSHSRPGAFLSVCLEGIRTHLAGKGRVSSDHRKNNVQTTGAFFITFPREPQVLYSTQGDAPGKYHSLFYGSWTREFISDFPQEKPAQDDNPWISQLMSLRAHQ